METKKCMKKPLASELLKGAKEVLEFVEKTDVSALSSWLHKDKHLPLICVGSGGKRTSYASVLYEMMDSVSRNVTPLEFAAMSPKVLSNSKILLLSTSGKNMDIKFAAKRALQYNKENTACITFSDKETNAVLKLFDADGVMSNCFLFKNDFKDNFISIRGKFLLFGLFYKAFSGNKEFSERLNYEGKYTYKINATGELPQLSSIKNLCVLYGSYGEPVAREIESIMAESGVASVVISDYRNYCHGRFIFAGNHCKSKKVPETDTCMILLVSPRERKLADGIRKNALPDNMPVVEIVTDHNNALASMQLLIDALTFIFEFAEEHHGINPNDPKNYSGIDKRAPINRISYITELERFGELSI